MCDSDSPCDITRPEKGSPVVDDALDMYRSSHAAVARYSVYKSEWYPRKKKTTIDSGLTWDEASAMRDQLNSENSGQSFGGPVYCIQLENPDEALAATQAASKIYWEARRAS